MKIIDFDIKGNQVLFYVGADNCDNYWGDDWDDRPYEHNAGKVYDEFILGWFVKTFDFHDIVAEPATGEYNSPYTKEDMIKRKVPCVCVLPKEYKERYDWCDSFKDICNNEHTIKFYFGDKVDENVENIHYIKNVGKEKQYVSLYFEAPEKLKHIVLKTFSKNLSFALGDKWVRDFDEQIVNKAQTLKKNDYKKMISNIINANEIFFTKEEIALAKKTLKVELYNRTEMYKEKETKTYVCCVSDCVFDIGEIRTK